LRLEDGVNHDNGVAVAAYNPSKRRDLAMLTTSTRLKLQAILRRLATGTSVSLEERVYLQKFADCDRTVASWLRQARRQQLAGHPFSGMDGFLNELDLGASEPNQEHRPDRDDLGDWFGGADPWLRRD